LLGSIVYRHFLFLSAWCLIWFAEEISLSLRFCFGLASD
jgi:hypothetical protein